jgi:hypothetical protein
MKRLLLALLAALALPTAVNAESYWLIIHMSRGGGYNALEKIEVSSLEACEKEGRRWENSPTQGFKSIQRRFHCVVGK